MYHLVETQKHTYLCAEVKDKDGEVKLVSAAIVDRTKDPVTIARQYMAVALAAETVDVRLAKSLIIEDVEAPTVTPIVDLMNQYVPIAEKKVLARLIFEEITRILPAKS